MSNKPTRAQLLAQSLLEAAKKAETNKSYSCPGCGMVLEGWRPSEETSGTDNDDDGNVGDRPDMPEEFDDKAKALKAKYAGRKLSVVDNILITRGIDPLED
jgi:hypothetical protein